MRKAEHSKTVKIGFVEVTATYNRHEKSGDGIDTPIEPAYNELCEIFIGEPREENRITEIVEQDFFDSIESKINE